MTKVYRVDSHGKPIVHGRRYVYVNDDPWATAYHGVILWDREILSHVFHPDNVEMQPAIVHYWSCTLKEEKWLNASGYVREPKKRKAPNGRRVVQGDEPLSELGT